MAKRCPNGHEVNDHVRFCPTCGAAVAQDANQQAQAQKPPKVSDNAGNETDCPSFTVRIDKTKPTCSVTKSNLDTTVGVTTAISASDVGGSQLNTSASASGESGVKSSKTYTVYD